MRSRWTTAALVVGLGALLRIPGMRGRPDDWDGVDFLLAVDEFDIASYQPHFPGYPLYVAAGWLVARLGVEPAWALEIVGVAGAIGLALVVLAANWRSSGALWAVAVSLLVATHPTLVECSVRIGSDSFGLALVAAGAALHLGRRPLAAGLVFGLGLGARPSYFPLASVLLVRPDRSLPPRRWRTGVGLAAGTLLWLAPLAVFQRESIVAEAAAFLRGHFLDWGGGVLARNGAGDSLWDRVGHLVAAAGGGTVALGCLGGTALAAAFFAIRGVGRARQALPPFWSAMAAAVVGAPARRGRWLWYSLAGAGPYLLWCLAAQDAKHARHALPLALGVCATAAAALRSAPRGSVLALGLAAAWSVTSFAAVKDRAACAPPAEALARHVLLYYPPASAVLYAGESYRLLSWLGVGRHVQVSRARGFSGVVDDVNAQLELPSRILVTSEVAGLPPDARSRASFVRPGVVRSDRLDLFELRCVPSGVGGAVLLVPVDVSRGVP